MTFNASETLREDELEEPPQGRGRWWLALFVLVVIVAAIAIYLRSQRERPWDSRRLTAQLFYISIAPPSELAARRPDAPISFVRFHYFVHNNGASDYRIPASAAVMEREGTAVEPASGISREAPPVIPAAQQVEVIITKPYDAESLAGDAWRQLYPDETLPQPDEQGGYPRVALPVPVAQSVMAKRSLTPDALVAIFDVVGDGPARECTDLARAVIHRKFPMLSGFTIVDSENRVKIEFPLPPG